MRIFWSLLLILAASCSGEGSEGRGGLSRAEADELNEAAAMLDAQQMAVDEALNRQ